jgi:hypothetical protein
LVPSTLTVTNNLDSGAGSLRADIAAAHNGDTIVFAPSLDGQTITLTSGELLIRKNLTIAGPGAGELTVSGNNASRVFEVTKTPNSVTLSGLTISKGVANGVGLAGEGGGILNHGTLTVSAGTLSGNSAAQGGGILNDGTMTVSHSTLTGNSSGQGGGILNDGTLTVSGSTLSSNGSLGLSYGGGIFNFGTLTVSGSTLSGNSAWRGGGIWNGGTATVSDGSTLFGNSASTGGGILNDGTLTVSNSTLTGNSASYGGGINNQGTLTVSGSTLSGNVATSAGGGIYNYVTGTATVKNSSSITGNTARVGFGADVYNSGVLYLDASSIIGILDGNPPVRI